MYLDPYWVALASGTVSYHYPIPFEYFRESFENSFEKTPRYKLRIRAESRSKAKLLRVIPSKEFIVGEPFEIRIHVKNDSEKEFPGGKMVIEFRWPSDQIVRKLMKIPKLRKGEEKECKEYKPSGKLGVIEEKPMAPGYGLLFVREAKANDKSNIQVLLEDGERDASSVSFHQILVSSKEEIYQRYSIYISAFSLCAILLIEILKLLFLR